MKQTTLFYIAGVIVMLAVTMLPGTNADDCAYEPTPDGGFRPVPGSGKSIFL